MKRRIRNAWCILVVATQAWAGPFENGIKAYDEGKFETALSFWLPLAEQGLAAAQFNLGILYEKGQGVTQDFAESARWYLKAAERGDPDAQFKVAALYENGNGLPLDPEKARQWYDNVLANPRRDQATLDTKRRALERLRHLPPALGETEEIFAYKGGRFLLRRAPSGDCVVALQGSVTHESKSSFDDVIKKAAAVSCSKPWTLLLESPGGLVFDGITLGEQVRAQELRTVARYGCASACSLIFLGGVERVLWGSRAAIGLHQPKTSALGCDQFGIGVGTYRMKEYLHEVVPANADRIIEIIMNTSCESIEWIHGKRAVALGIATKIEAEGVDVFGPEASRRWIK
jgi:ATP-dependent protease ClpP protease subunit